MNTTTIHIETTTAQLHQLQRTARTHRRLILIIDADAIAVSEHHSEAWLAARKLACATWCNDDEVNQ